MNDILQDLIDIAANVLVGLDCNTWTKYHIFSLSPKLTKKSSL